MELTSEQLSFLLETDAGLHALFAEDDLRALAADEQPKYVTNYIGSKQKLVEWIWANTPQGVSSMFDAFSGSAVVGYMYKRQGLRVATNDRLRYAWHISRAIIENTSTTLTDEEIDRLLAPNAKAGDFVEKHFSGKYFSRGVHPLIDTIRANIDGLKGYKKDIALFALGKAPPSA